MQDGRPSPRDLSTMLAARAEEVCRHYLPAGNLAGSRWEVGDLNNAPGKSLKVDLAGKRRGRWSDYETGDKGDLLDLIQHTRGFPSLGPAMAEARHFLGIPNLQPANPSHRPTAAAPAKHPVNPSVRAVRHDDAHSGAPRLWDACEPLPGTLAELYLRNRGITETDHDALRFHPKLRYRDDNYVTYRPAMIACIRGADGRVNAVHRTWLDATGLDKAQLPQPRKLLDSPKGAGVLFHPERMATSDIAVGEGIETVLSVLSALPGCAGIATLTSNVMAGIPIPPSTGRILIAVDRDPAGYPAACRLEDRLKAEGRDAHLVLPERDDLNDDIKAIGADRLRRQIEAQLASTARPQLAVPASADAAPVGEPAQAMPEPILNLSRAQLTPELRDAGVVELHETDRKALVNALSLNAAPGPYQVRKCAGIWADIAKVAAGRLNTRKVLVLADSWLIGPLERELRARGLEPVHAF
ncbi:MAG: toprim domain-containing protein, partial [Rhodospirillales bacterium]|nr:toprim domain-containing protein [Rhodospirillales bacterium]